MKFKKHTVIQVGDNKIIVSDGEINSDDCWYIDDTNIIRKSITNDADYWKARKDYTKIIAQLPSEKTLDGIPIAEEIGVEQLAEYYGKLTQGEINPLYSDKFKNHVEHLSKIDFIAGYNLSKSDGVFNESDMIGFLRFYRKTAVFGFESTGENIEKSDSELLSLYIQSLPQSINLLCSDDGEPIMIDNTFKYRK